MPSVKHGGGSVMVWSWFAGRTTPYLMKMSGTMRKEVYLNTLPNHAIPCGNRLVGEPFVIQQDNDLKHADRICKKTFK